MDLLSDVLSLVKPRDYTAGGLSAGGRWGLQFPAYKGVKCYAIVKGDCWIAVDGLAPVHVAAGDGVLLPRGRPFRLCSALDVPAVDATTLALNARYNGILVGAPGDEFMLLGGHFVMDDGGDLLLGVLPPLVHLRDEDEKAALRGAVERIAAELRAPQPGGLIMAQHGAYTLLVLAIRLYINDGARNGFGWLAALADKQIAGAIAAMHAEPARGWTVQTLAETAGMSRTTFAERFHAMVGSTPLEHLTRWRMLVAADRLLYSSDGLAAIARSVGYESESAFGAAFKRMMGSSPREYGREHKRP